MIIRQYKNSDEIIEELKKELNALFIREGMESSVFQRYFTTIEHVNKNDETLIAALCERLMQGKRYIYPYRFNFTYNPNSFKAPIKDKEVDGLLYFDEKDFDSYRTGSYFEKFNQVLHQAFNKFE